MNGKHHFSFSLYILIILSVLLWHYQSYRLVQLERCGFLYLIVVLYLNPDSEINSMPSHNLGIFKYFFLPLHHRGISHSLIAWGVLGIGFWYFGLIPEAIGLVCASYSHILPDRISTGFKRLNPF